MYKKISVVSFFAFLTVYANAHENSQQKPTDFSAVSVETREGFPDVEEFFKKFVIPGVPVIFKAASSDFVPDFGESDLATSPLSFTTYVDAKKKGDANVNYHMSVRQFLKRYRDEELYIDDVIPAFLKSHVPLPRCLLCPTVIDELLSTRFLFLHGKKEESLSTTERNFIGCQIIGILEMQFIGPMSFPDNDNQDEAGLKMAMKQNDKAGNKTYLTMHKDNHTYFGKLEAGDCVYVPALWLYRWTTYGNSVNVGLFWSRKKIEPTSEVCETQSKQNLMALDFKDDPKPHFPSLPIFNDLHHFIKNYFLKEEKKGITFEALVNDLKKDPKYADALVEWNPQCYNIAKELFQDMDANDDDLLSLRDFDQLSHKDLEDMAAKIKDRLADLKNVLKSQAAEGLSPLGTTKNSPSDYEKGDKIDAERKKPTKKAKQKTKKLQTTEETGHGNEKSGRNNNTKNQIKDTASEEKSDGGTIDVGKNVKQKSITEQKKDEL